MSSRRTTFSEVVALLNHAENILLLNPAGGDGDSFGASLAVAHHCSQIRKPYTLFAHCAQPETYRFLPRFFEIRSDPGTVDFSSFDLIVAFDFANPELSGIAQTLDQAVADDRCVVNIDHHKTNTQFGTLNLVDASYAATAEMVHELFVIGGWELDAHVATCLLTGIVGDTGMFSYRNTTERTLAVAARMLRCGARLNMILGATRRNKSHATLQLWGTALMRLTLDPHTQLVTTYLTREDFAACNADETAAEGIANFLNLLGEGDGALFLRELPGGKVKASLRTMNDHTDVAELAQRFGGGGHRRAAGFTIDGTVNDLRRVWKLSPQHDILVQP